MMILKILLRYYIGTNFLRVYFHVSYVRLQPYTTIMENVEFRSVDPIQRDLLLEVPTGSHCTKAQFIIDSHCMDLIGSISVHFQGYKTKKSNQILMKNSHFSNQCLVIQRSILRKYIELSNFEYITDIWGIYAAH